VHLLAGHDELRAATSLCDDAAAGVDVAIAIAVHAADSDMQLPKSETEQQAAASIPDSY
jgi:hypothetical protein